MDLVPVLLNTTVERAADARDRFTEGDTDRARLRLEEVASATAVLLRLLASLHPGSPVADELDAEQHLADDAHAPGTHADSPGAAPDRPPTTTPPRKRKRQRGVADNPPSTSAAAAAASTDAAPPSEAAAAAGVAQTHAATPPARTTTRSNGVTVFSRGSQRFICIPKSLVGMSGRPDTRPATHAPSDELDQAALARSLLPLGMFDPAATFGGTLQHPFGPAIVHDSPSPPPRAAQLPGQDGQPPGAETQPFAVLNLPHVAQALDDIFFKFLARICSDPLFKDPSGERLNASTYSAKRASKADELLEFMTFKFKVRPFTDAFVHQVGLVRAKYLRQHGQGSSQDTPGLPMPHSTHDDQSALSARGASGLQPPSLLAPASASASRSATGVAASAASLRASNLMPLQSPSPMIQAAAALTAISTQNPEFAAVDAQPQSDPPAQPNNRNNRNGSGSGSGNGSNSNNSNPQQPLSLPPRHAQTLATTPRLSESALHMYIRQHRFLCRYRAKDGRLVKSSGRCCFLVNARKSASDEWVFCEFEPFLGGEEPPSTIQIGQSFSYTPLVVDPQHKDIKAAFHSPWLPHWLRWRDGTLVGIPDINSRSCEITVVAVFALPGQGARRTLERTIEITVLPAVASDAGGGGRRPRTVDRRAVGSAAM